MTSRQILIIAIVVLVAIVCVGLYFLIFAPRGGTVAGHAATGLLPNAVTGTSGNAASSTTGLAKNFGVIADVPVLDYFVSDSNLVTAVQPDGQIIQVANGQVSTISSTTLQNIISAGFSYDGARILVSFGDPANPQTSVFTVATNSWTPLPTGLLSPVWSPTDYRVAYATANAAEGTESFVTIDGSKPKPTPVVLLTLHVQDLMLAWPSKNQLVLATKPSALVAGSAWSFNLATSALAPVAIETPGLMILWSGEAGDVASSLLTPPASLEFSSAASGYGGSLALADGSGNITQELKFVTLPSKCAFAAVAPTPPIATTTSTTATSTPYLFCGVPRDTNTFSISHLPDDYYQMTLFTSDDVYSVNLQTGAIDTIFNDATQNFDTSDVKFFNNTLFFINRYDQKLYGVQLTTGA